MGGSPSQGAVRRMSEWPSSPDGVGSPQFRLISSTTALHLQLLRAQASCCPNETYPGNRPTRTSASQLCHQFEWCSCHGDPPRSRTFCRYLRRSHTSSSCSDCLRDGRRAWIPVTCVYISLLSPATAPTARRRLGVSPATGVCQSEELHEHGRECAGARTRIPRHAHRLRLRD